MRETSSWRLLVTGGSGFIGTNLIDHFAGRVSELLNVDIGQPAKPTHSKYWRPVDITNHSAAQDAFAQFQPTHVLHMAARTDLDGRLTTDYLSNTLGTRAVTEAIACLPGPVRFIHASSRLVCPVGYTPNDEFDVRPTTAYGASKVESERIVRASGLECWTIVRPTSIWGPWFGVPYRGFFKAVAHGRYLHPRNRQIWKSFGYVGNTVNQLERLLAAASSVVHAETTYLADPPLEVGAWADVIAAQSARSPARRVPKPVLTGMALTGDVLVWTGIMKHPPLTSFRLGNLLSDMLYDVPLIQLVASEPLIPVTAAVEDTLSWMRTQGDLPSTDPLMHP